MPYWTKTTLLRAAFLVLLLLGGSQAALAESTAPTATALSSTELSQLRKHLQTKAPKKLYGKTAGSELTRSFKQAVLGIPRVMTKIDGPTTLVGNGRWLGEQSDISKLAKGNFRAGSIWQAWVTTKNDVQAERPRPRGWDGPIQTAKNAKINALPTDWRGVFANTSFGGLENGFSRGHILPNKEAVSSHAEQKKTFTLFSNAFPQSRDSNAGAWRNFEKTVQGAAASGDYVVYNYGGVLWNPTHYTKFDGSKATVHPEVLKSKDGGEIPKPTAYWRVSLLVPTKHPVTGQTMDLAQGLQHARPLSAIVPNAQDAELFVSHWNRFSASISDVEKATGLKFFTRLDKFSSSKKLIDSLRKHKDMGKGLEQHELLPKWKRAQLKQLLANPQSVSKQALAKAKQLLKQDKLDAKKLAMNASSLFLKSKTAPRHMVGKTTKDGRRNSTIKVTSKQVKASLIRKKNSKANVKRRARAR